MRIAAMQPYFLPYLGYFSLIAATERFVVFDPVQYIRHGWINRNRILKPNRAEPQYITIPVAKHPRDTAISEIGVSTGVDWRARMLAQVQHYRRFAPHFDSTVELLSECLAWQGSRLSELNVHSLRTVCQTLDIPFSPMSFDEVAEQDLDLRQAADRIACVPSTEGTAKAESAQDDFPRGDWAPGDWALAISRALNATCYINPPGGRDIFDAGKFRDSGIQLQFLSNSLEPYSQRNANFVPGLSIVDVLMFNGIDETRRMIFENTVVSQ